VLKTIVHSLKRGVFEDPDDLLERNAAMGNYADGERKAGVPRVPRFSLSNALLARVVVNKTRASLSRADGAS
jgi:hypothetical protein